MTHFDPRAQLAWLAALVLVVLLGSVPGVAVGMLFGLTSVVTTRAWRAWLRLLAGLAPLVLILVLIDALAGDAWTGARVAARLVILATLGQAFARGTNAEGLVAGMRALR